MRLALKAIAVGALVVAIGGSSTEPAVAAGGTQFIRGDVNIDGNRNIADPVALLDWMFIPGAGTPPPCEDSADINDDGMIDMADVIFSLNFMFLPGSPPIPEPMVCGVDPTADGLACDVFGVCPPASGVDFNTFVLDLIDQTADNTDPVEINAISFCFDENPTAFDVLLLP